MDYETYEVIVLGAGPAGLQAAIHAARRKVSVAVIGKTEKSSAYRAHIENFCCVKGQTGKEMLALGRDKAESAGAVMYDADVTSLDSAANQYLVKLDNGGVLSASALVLAMGISRNTLGLAEEKKLIGKGVSYCVDCDGPLFKNRAVAVVGGGSAAVSGALTLLFYTGNVHLISEQLEVGDYLSENLKESAVVLHQGRRVTGIKGDDAVTGLALDNGVELNVTGVFIELGAKGALNLATTLGILSDETMKYIAVNKQQETNLPGVYAAGDICGPPWQMAKSVGEGCVAGLEAAAYVRKLKAE